MKVAASVISVIFLSSFGAFAGMAQTLTSTFKFTGTGVIGTPATATTPFQGKTFTDAAITITAVANTANRTTSCGGQSCYVLSNDSASISISGIGTFQFAASEVLTYPVVDPIKGVVAVDIYFSASTTSTGPADVLVEGRVVTATAWTMLNSVGPLNASWSSHTNVAFATNGGALQFTSRGLNGTFQATITGGVPTPVLSRYGILSHIAAGGGWTTAITLVNTTSAAVPVELAFHSESGGALALPVTTTQQGASQTSTASNVNATIAPNTSLRVSVGDPLSPLSVGWADVLSTGVLGGYAIFRGTEQSGWNGEGTVPLESQYASMLTLPFDNASGFAMGMALANLSTSTATITATIWDDSGNQLDIQSFIVPGNGHTSFTLPDQFPRTAGKRGIVRFQSSASDGIAGLGLRFSPYGTFTSVPTM